MRVPVPPSQTNNSSPNPKLNTGRPIGFHSPAHPPNLFYEPTSVLDLRRSPSPVADKPVPASEAPASNNALSRQEEANPVEWDEHVLHNLDWDSIMKDLGFHDDSASAFKPNSAAQSNCDSQVQHIPEFLSSQPFDPAHLVHSDLSLSDLYVNQGLAQNYGPFDLGHDFPACNFGLDIIQDVMRAAECFDSNELQLAHVILERLNQRLQSSTGKPLQRAAFYFKEALQSLLTGSNRTPRLSSWLDIIHSIRAFKAFSAISPIPMFPQFTTNQALLEALNGSSFIHVIDFDIGLGGQYASLMKEISEKADSRKTYPPVLRITAVVPEEFAVESRLIKENLAQFAQDLKIRFQIDFLLLRTFEAMSFKAVKFMDGEKTAILLTPAIFRRLGTLNSITAFLGDVRRVSPCVVVFVDGEGWTEAGTASFKRNLVESLEFHATVLESLDAAAAGDWARRIETLLVRPKILAAVEWAVRKEGLPCRELFHGAGMRPVQLSQFADFQAEYLLGKVQVRGFQVGKRQAELVLYWREKALVTTSAWRC